MAEASVKAKCGQECGFALEEALERAEAQRDQLLCAIKQWRDSLDRCNDENESECHVADTEDNLIAVLEQVEGQR